MIPLPLCGEYKATSIASVTLSIQTRASSGSVTIAAQGQAASAIEWSITQIDQSFPTPLIANGVVSQSAGVELMCRATVTSSCTTDPCTIASQSGCATAINRSATGTYNATLTGYSGTPSCTCKCGNLSCYGGASTDTSTTVYWVCRNTGGTATDGVFNIMCMGPK